MELTIEEKAQRFIESLDAGINDQESANRTLFAKIKDDLLKALEADKLTMTPDRDY